MRTSSLNPVRASDLGRYLASKGRLGYSLGRGCLIFYFNSLLAFIHYFVLVFCSLVHSLVS